MYFYESRVREMKGSEEERGANLVLWIGLLVRIRSMSE